MLVYCNNLNCRFCIILNFRLHRYITSFVNSKRIPHNTLGRVRKGSPQGKGKRLLFRILLINRGGKILELYDSGDSIHSAGVLFLSGHIFHRSSYSRPQPSAAVRMGELQGEFCCGLGVSQGWHTQQQQID